MIKTAPDGYTEKWDSNICNVGDVFRWSSGKWLDCGQPVTIKPNMSPVGILGPDFRVFFVKE